ncbi:putative disease resistance RPP13-like protein 1 [Sesamum angolense]|uniref:Disease resistance RPP13-like protein 1 n=1 Tax=Sesamum angolense TaxID=2727404 RepID=A0AAE1WFL5_9LAMI|nr:putative disease resistance RPP13-like protein 1 [Sesamum angolense]
MNIWEIDQKQSDILPILRLSYEKLPPHLRQCFAYCSMLPKGFEIPREVFINLWIAQEVVEAFDGEILVCRIHNLVHDLAQSVAGDESLNVKADIKSISDRVRHLYLHDDDLHCNEMQTPAGLVLQALDLEELPSSIGGLQQLRYLDLSHSSNLRSLPKSFCKLVNLQTLNLMNCEKFQDLPGNFRSLVSIKTLYLTCREISLTRKSLQSFNSIQFLLLYNCNFVQLPSEGFQNLNSLRVLRIYDCPRLASLPGNIKYLTALEKLWIWNCEVLDLSDGDGLEGLTSLESLLLMGLPKLINLPMGLTENVAKTLKFFRIANCANFAMLPEWLLSFNLLQRLYVEDCPNLSFLPQEVGSHIAKVHVSGCPKLGKV